MTIEEDNRDKTRANGKRAKLAEVEKLPKRIPIEEPGTPTASPEGSSNAIILILVVLICLLLTVIVYLIR